MTSASFRRMARLTASTKRSPLIAGGKVGVPALHVPELRCTPLDPISAETAQRLGLDTPYTLRQIFVADVAPDVVKGDLLVVDGHEYPVRAVEPWDWSPGETYLRVVVEVLER